MDTARFVSAGWKVRPYRNAPAKYGWPDDPYGLAVSEGTCHIAIDSEKHILFKVERARYHYGVDPAEAIVSAKKHGAYFTNRDGRLFLVVPKSLCYRVDKKTSKAVGDTPRRVMIYE